MVVLLLKETWCISPQCVFYLIDNGDSLWFYYSILCRARLLLIMHLEWKLDSKLYVCVCVCVCVCVHLVWYLTGKEIF